MPNFKSHTKLRGPDSESKGADLRPEKAELRSAEAHRWSGGLKGLVWGPQRLI